MRAALIGLLLAPAAATAWIGDANRLSDLEARLAKGTSNALDEAAEVPWPLLGASAEQVLVSGRAQLSPAARRAWALDRALPMLAGELPASSDTLDAVLGEIRSAVADLKSNADLGQVESARREYATGEFQQAQAKYAQVTRASPLWPDALRERAWTLLVLKRPNDALGATVSLSAPYFAQEDHAEGRLLRATVLLGRCRYAEARDIVAPLTAMELPSLDETGARTVLTQSAAPSVVVMQRAWDSPLVARVRAALSLAGTSDPRHDRLVALGSRLLMRAVDAESEVLRDAKERALKVRYEALRGERHQLEIGKTSSIPVPVPPPQLDDDEVAWDFDGKTFWRDELGAYRFSAGNACPQESGK